MFSFPLFKVVDGARSAHEAYKKVREWWDRRKEGGKGEVGGDGEDAEDDDNEDVRGRPAEGEDRKSKHRKLQSFASFF